MVSNLHSEQLSAGLCLGQGSLLLAGPLSRYPQCHNGLAPSRSEHMCLCRSVPRGGSWYDKWEGFLYLCPLSPARHWVRVEYNIVLYRVHVPIIVKCQGNGCSLSSKDGAVIRESLDSWRQVVSPFWKWRLTTAAAPTLSLILYPSVSTSLCGHWASWYSLNLAWASSLVIIHLLPPSMRCVFLWIILMCPWWKTCCPYMEHQFYIDLCRGHGFL